ncbi:chromodomain-helicase-DNA-binding protein 1-like isoform X1 [Siniperca chuatsi]|uniref:chromodomain-helicase-DNA-binding protein 1-like isoform X1 n=2 Tax=Siniperca chuatsi TaxID=119488 RepID=UPI001CE1EC3E|nr:chromodomain-helicase-DNA-binding protein 1-like isoform X1 [Siniperca chuatsi]
MTDISLKIKNSVGEKKKTAMAQSDLKKWGLRGIQLRPYQLDGVQWLTQCLKNQQGCILGDEMGLGKTCQTISLLVYMSGALGRKGPFLVLSPLSVMENWRKELECFAPCLTVLCYKGDKERRAELQRETDAQDFHVLLTTYELCLKDASFLRRWKWKVLVVDEAHRLKNQNSLLHKTLTQFLVGFRVLLTGTPIQNNLQELYSLLSFIQPSIFTADETDDFVNSYSDVQSQPALAAELQSVLEPFLLRRVKSEVAVDLPKKTELVVYHGMSALQKKYYKAILMKDLEAFGNEQGNKNQLLNILMNLRKCVDHPYLFDGVEPEPFEMGEHLVEASGKLCLLDSMLTYLHKGGHRILLFSQMTRMLDILQDYMEYRGYSYERLDGSVRGEERNLAVKNFSNKEIFVFLLSTKAGGVGLNLTAADTVIFMDSDFNPQNDLQAAARCHRIGQNRPVKVIRLLARDTVEEIMYSRAVSKLHLTNTVIEEGRFSLLDQAQSAAAGLQLSEILKFGIDKLLSSEESSVQDVKLEKILGPSRDGLWLDDEDFTSLREEEEEEGNGSESDGQNHMYYFEGKDYSKDPSSEDQKSFDCLLKEQLAEFQRAAGEGRALRHKAGVSLSVALEIPTRKRKPLTEAELELRRQRREEAAAKRAKIEEDVKKKQQEQKYKKKMAWWESCGYRSLSLPSLSVDSEEEEQQEEDDSSVCSTGSDSTAIHYVLGDVTHPHAAQGDAIIVHCVDDAGRWGRGGLFTALEVRSDEPRKRYELAGKMKDLDLGNVLLFPIDDKQSRLDGQDQLALIVTQQRDKANNLSGILLTALDEGLKKIYASAKRNKASVHLPRIGHATKGFNWYGTERLIRKHLASRGIPTFIYYHSRTAKNTAPPQTSTPATLMSTSSPEPQLHNSDRLTEEMDAETPSPSAPLQSPGPAELPSFMRGVCVFFYNLPASERKRLGRYLITYDGDEEEIMSPEVTHIVAEVENSIHSQELQDLVREYTQAVPVQKAWLESCFSKQRKVNTALFLHPLR